ncbi:MAG: putative multidrug resistance protein EmrK [Alphaproteobacteria bacterium MarineAlpha3_Bin2]|jgi:membrane fusion protein (multidrug efflux system)|nr:MAG: putative multidrug resistance protein EmrK [Alphaproteobacteria bacterium MarineAlpha3_Bin2]
MPDGTDPKNKKTLTEAEKPVTAEATEFAQDRPSRKLLRLVLIVAILSVAVYYGGREVTSRIDYVYTEDSRIQADLIVVSSRVDGWVTSLGITEGSTIAAGNVLAAIDSRESKLRVVELKAQISGIEAERSRLAAERRLVDEQTASLYSSERSQLESAQVTVSSLQPQLDLAKRELQRAKSLFDRKVFSRRQLDQADTALQQIDRENRMAVADLKAAQAKLKEAGAERTKLDVLDGEISILKHRKAEMMARLEHQKLDLADRTIKSPVNGVVDKTFVKVGEYVTPGQRLALVHDPDKIWIEANIKETQIRKLKIGQRVELGVDAYPDIAFEGRVLSIGNATTSEFALLPSPNPSGNFTKITQRLPVRIALQQKDGLLRPGMMVEVNIDIRNP